MKKVLLGLAVVSAMTLSSQAAAQWSVGAGYGQSNLKSAKDHCKACVTLDDSDSVLNLNVGYNFNKSWGVEAGYMDFGKFRMQGKLDDVSTRTDIDSSAVYFAGTGTYWLNDKISLTGRLGWARVDNAPKNRLFTSSWDDSKNRFILGAGVDYNFNKNFSVGVRYDNFNHPNALSLAAKYRF